MAEGISMLPFNQIMKLTGQVDMIDGRICRSRTNMCARRRRLEGLVTRGFIRL